MSIRWAGWLVASAMAASAADCRKPEASPSTGAPRAETQASADRAPVAASPPTVLVDPTDSDRWVFVETARDGAKGAWAAGSFDAERNKLSVRTQDVERFDLNLERVAVDWNRLVVISIDGRSSELKRREQARLRFGRDQQGNWVVLEEKSQP